MRRLKRFFWMTLALAFLGVSWLWDTLHPLIRAIVDWIPLESLKRAVAQFLAGLPPYPTLIVFLIPLVAVEPLKVVALWLLAHKRFVPGVALYVGTDVLRLGLVSFMFRESKDKLLSIAWFRWLYEMFLRAHEWAHEQVAPLKAAIRQALREAGLAGGRGGFWRKTMAVWRYARRGGFSSV